MHIHLSEITGVLLIINVFSGMRLTDECNRISCLKVFLLSLLSNR